MSTGVYKRTKEHSENISKGLKGNKNAEGMIPWNKGKKIPFKKRKPRLDMLGDKNPAKCKEVQLKIIQNHPDFSGENNPNWKGGFVEEVYPREFNEELKEYIRNLDNRKCFCCGKIEEESGRKLCVHHIDYNKDNIAEYNLISLCISCHSRTNTHRDYWSFQFEFWMDDPHG